MSSSKCSIPHLFYAIFLIRLILTCTLLSLTALAWLNKSSDSTHKPRFIEVCLSRVRCRPKRSRKLWNGLIQSGKRSASHREEENRKKERAMKIARELSNLVIYCQSVVFNSERLAHWSLVIVTKFFLRKFKFLPSYKCSKKSLFYCLVLQKAMEQ